MKKVFEKVWEWMKSTAWFQVVLLVGIVVAVVLAISPITKGIENAVSDNKRAKYYENNRINYNEMMSKINGLDGGGEEFAVIFMDPSTTGATDLQEGVQKYEDLTGSVKIYSFNFMVNYDNKSTYDQDINWYNYYEVNNYQMTGIRNASKDVYKSWMDFCTSSNTNEVSQSTDYPDATSTSTCLNSPTLMWFRHTDNIDASLVEKTTVLNPDPNVNKVMNYHVAKVYTTIENASSGSDTASKTLGGLQMFFMSSLLK